MTVGGTIVVSTTLKLFRLRGRRWTLSAVLITLIAGGALALTATASAQGDNQAALAQARRHMEEGQSLYLQSRNLEAATEFLAGYEVRPFAAFLYNAGISYERHGDIPRAMTLYQRYITESENASDRGEVEQRIVTLQARLSAESPTGETDPTGETSNGNENGDPAGEGPNNTSGDPENGQNSGTENTGSESTGPENTGTESTGPENNGAENTGSENSGSENGESGVLLPGPERAMKSLLSVETNPAGAQVSLRQDGQVVASGPSPFNETLNEGTYTISVEHPDFQTITHEMRIRAGKVYVAVLEMSQGNFAGMLRVVSDPPGASVFVDDREAGSLGQTPFQNVVPVGTHRVWIERPGYDVVEQEVEVALGDQAELSVPLERVSYGRLRITGNVRGAEVFIDDVLVGTVPYEGEVDAGEHELRVSADDMKDYEETLLIERGQLTPVTVELKPAVSRSGAWVTAVLGALSIGGGTALYLLSQNNLDELRADARAGTLVADDERFLRGRIYTAGSYAAFGLGALLGVLSIYYFARDGQPDSEGDVLEPRDWTITPTATRDHAGLLLEGSF